MYLTVNCSILPNLLSTPQAVSQQQSFSREGTANLVVSLVTVILGAVVAWQGRRLRAVLLEAVGLQHRARREGSVEDVDHSADGLEGPAECQRAAGGDVPPSLSRSSIERGFISEDSGSARVHHARTPYVHVDQVEQIEKVRQVDQEVHVGRVNQGVDNGFDGARVDQVEKTGQVEQEAVSSYGQAKRDVQADQVRQVKRSVHINSLDQS